MVNKSAFTIQNHPPRFWAAVLADGKQVLAGPMLPNILIYIFTTDGQFFEMQTVPLEHPLEWDPVESRYVPRPGFDQEFTSEIKKTLKRLNAVEATITIRPFFDDAHSVGILELPSDYSAFLEDPSYADNDDEAADFRESIGAWEREGRFVLVWGVELWMNRQGRLIAS